MNMNPSLTTVRCSVMLMALLAPASIFAQNRSSVSTAAASPGDEHSTFTRAVPCFGVRERQPEKQLERNAVAMLPKWDRLWLTEDVADLISPEERCAFLHLLTDEERTQFVEAFWARRAPDPTSLDNAFKREHYERIAFADEKFGSQIPGWKTDRGRIYVSFGPPDSIESHRAGETVSGAAADGVEKRPYPWVVWHYNQLQGKSENLEFVDPGGTGDYCLVMPQGLRDEVIYVPADDLSGTRYGEPQGHSAAITELRVGPLPSSIVHFKDLEAFVISGLERDQVHLTHRIEFSKATEATTLARIVVRAPGEQRDPSTSDALSLATFDVFGRISRPSGWIIETFEHKISADGQNNSAGHDNDTQFEAALAPGTYRLAIVVKNLDTGDVGTLHETIDVPSYAILNGAQSAH